MFVTKEIKKQTRGLAPVGKKQTSQERAEDKRQNDNSPSSIHFLQRHLGNTYVQSVVEGQQNSGEPATLSDSPVTQPGLSQDEKTRNQEIPNLSNNSEYSNGHKIYTTSPNLQPQCGVTKDSIIIQRQDEDESSEEKEREESIVIFEDEEYPVQMHAAMSRDTIALQITGSKTDIQMSNLGGKNLGDHILKSKGCGHALDTNIRTSLENYFQEDFSSVRLHNDLQADSLTKGLNAQALTAGEDIYFRRGYYNPSSRVGAHLLTHEIAHTRQQRRGVTLERSLPGSGIAIGKIGDVYEHEADRVADDFLRVRDKQAGECPKIGEARPPTTEHEEILPQKNSDILQSQEQNVQCQGGVAETAAAVVATAQAVVGAVRTVTHGNYSLTRPDRLDATVTPKKAGCNPANLPVKNWTWPFYSVRDTHIIFGSDYVNVDLEATWQTTGCDVRAFHVVSPAGHRRSRMMRDTTAQIFSIVSASLVSADPRARSCSDYAAQLLIPYEVTVDRQWPLSNWETDGRLYIDGAGGARKVHRTVHT